MGYNLSDKLVIGVSSRALFDLEEENRIFEEKGVDAYYQYQLKNENKIPKKGTGFRLIEKLLKINELFEERQVEVIILSRNNPATSLRITNAINHYKLDITRSAWTSGNRISKYLKPFKVDLFLSAHNSDVIDALKNGFAAAKILPYKNNEKNKTNPNQVNIAFDGDAVLFSEESELIYKEKGLEAFIKHEIEHKNDPMKKGPFAKFLFTIAELQKKIKTEPPIRTALVTARSAPTHERIIKTLNIWGVRIDEAFFLGGGDKEEILEAFEADIFFDDQDVHLNKSSKKVPSAKVVNENYK